MVAKRGYDSINRVDEGNTITEIYDDGTYTYICKAVKNSALTDSVWIIRRIVNSTGSSRITDINQLATNVTIVAALNYS